MAAAAEAPRSNCGGDGDVHGRTQTWPRGWSSGGQMDAGAATSGFGREDKHDSFSINTCGELVINERSKRCCVKHLPSQVPQH